MMARPRPLPRARHQRDPRLGTRAISPPPSTTSAATSPSSSATTHSRSSAPSVTPTSPPTAATASISPAPRRTDACDPARAPRSRRAGRASEPADPPQRRPTLSDVLVAVASATPSNGADLYAPATSYVCPPRSRPAPRAAIIGASEAQRPVAREVRDVDQRSALLVATSVGLAGGDPPVTDRPAGGSRRPPDPASPAGDLRRLAQAHAVHARQGVERDRRRLVRADDVHSPAREDEVVAADVVLVAGPVGDLNDPRGGVEHAAEGGPPGDDGALPTLVRRDHDPAQPLLTPRA